MKQNQPPKNKTGLSRTGLYYINTELECLEKTLFLHNVCTNNVCSTNSNSTVVQPGVLLFLTVTLMHRDYLPS